MKRLLSLGVAATLSFTTVTAASADVVPPTLNGIDVSSHQWAEAPVSWSTVESSFTFVKATEGTGYVNPYLYFDSISARANGHIVGSYHYARPSTSSGEDQANYYLDYLDTLPHKTLTPVLDIEVDEGLTAAELEAWIDDFVTTVQNRAGVDPIIYTYPNFWREAVGDSTEFSDLPLWIAHYGVNFPDVPGGWDDWDFWQSTNEGSTSGITGLVDHNVFKGTKTELKNYVM